MTQPKSGDLRVWSMTNFKPLRWYPVPDLETAAFLTETLSVEQLSTDEVETNAFGLVIYTDNEWIDWTGEDSKEDGDKDHEEFDKDLRSKYLSRFMSTHTAKG